MHRYTMKLACMAGLMLVAVACGGGGGGGGGGADGGTSGGGSSGGGTGAEHWKDVGFTDPDQTPLHGIWGTGPTDIWVVGRLGRAFHYNGTSWEERLRHTSLTSLRTVWGSDSDHLWVGGTGVLLQWDGSKWTDAATNVGSLTSLNGIWGTSSTDVWVVGTDGFLAHYGADGWTKKWSDSSIGFNAVWGTSADNVYAVGYNSNNGYILRWDGKIWDVVRKGTTSEPLTALRAVWGSAANDVWAGGGDHLARYDGASWKVEKCVDALTLDAGATIPGCPRNILGLWGTSSKDVWAVGGVGESSTSGSGYIAHWDGAKWTMSWRNGLWGVNRIWGSAPDDIWIAGEVPAVKGIVLKYSP